MFRDVWSMVFPDKIAKARYYESCADVLFWIAANWLNLAYIHCENYNPLFWGGAGGGGGGGLIPEPPGLGSGLELAKIPVLLAF